MVKVYFIKQNDSKTFLSMGPGTMQLMLSPKNCFEVTRMEQPRRITAVYLWRDNVRLTTLALPLLDLGVKKPFSVDSVA